MSEYTQQENRLEQELPELREKTFEPILGNYQKGYHAGVKDVRDWVRMESCAYDELYVLLPKKSFDNEIYRLLAEQEKK